MKEIKTKNPEEYWKIINKHSKNKKGQEQSGMDINILYQYFRDLNRCLEISDEINLAIDNDIATYKMQCGDLNQTLNKHINKIYQLKNNKASWEDEIRNEYIKATQQVLLPVYEKLFNLIFSLGKVPSILLEGNIMPLYKNKGGKTKPENYRPITILSCMGKLFTSIFNERLNVFSDEFDLLNENQVGFRKEYSTVDNLFLIYMLFDLLRMKKKKLYCIFVHFEKAFDNVWRKVFIL